MKRLILLLLIPLFACSHLERNKTTMKYLSLIAVLICSYVQAYWELIPGTESLEVWLLESDGRRLYAISDTGFYLSFDDGFTWRHRDIGRGIDDFYISAIGSGDGAVYVGTVDHGVFRSDDGGNTWKHINEGLHIFDDPKRGPRHGIVYQLLVTSSGMVISVGYHQGTHISRNRGDSWRDVTLEWKASQGPGSPDIIVGGGIFSMGEFDGYLWAAYSNDRAFRSPDDGDTWEIIPYWDTGSINQFDRVHDWAVLHNNQYIAGNEGFGRWHEGELMWANLSRGLPDEPYMKRLAINRDRIFATVGRWGVWLFDQRSETWLSIGLQEIAVTSLVSHQSDLYAGTREGIYRASIPVVQPYGKSATTWGAIKGDFTP